jgi:hypothetical protein
MTRVAPDLSEQPPFFVVGAPRSGTTLLRLLLGHHPDICGCEEMNYVTPALVEHGGPPPDLEAYRHFLRLNRGFRMSGYEIDPGLDFEQLPHSFLAQRRRLDGRPLVGAVVHHHFDQILRIWPGARFILLNRDPRDVARSSVKMGWAGSAWGGATTWLHAQDAWARLCANVPAARRVELRFEDLVDEPKAVLERACELIGTHYDPAMMELDADTTYSRPTPHTARSWRDSASPREIAQVETRVGHERLERAGYEPSGLPPLPSDPITRLGVHAEDVFNRVRFRQRRYGVGLWIAGVIARRQPISSIRKAVQARREEINNQYLK